MLPHLIKRSNLAQTRDILILVFWKCVFHQLLTPQFYLHILATVEPNDICDELSLLRQKVPVSPVYLVIDMPRINKEYFILALCLLLSLIKEPEGDRKRNVIKEV
ncbi:hypothetical protein BMS3Bbin08_00129 [bacterium BMS3Bbin08]|nr:hypothetical protein BMS3Bbin08_00129 [bacterium BMS3Bbin08]